LFDKEVWDAALLIARFYKCLPFHKAIYFVYRLYELNALR